MANVGSGPTNSVLAGRGNGESSGFTTTPTIDQGTIQNSPSNPTDIATKAYVDAIASGAIFKEAVYAASTGALNATYLNGISGVGATLTNAGSLVAFSVDGVSPPINSRILIKDQSSTLQNGIYTLTTVGDGSTAWILTRATDYDQNSEILPGTVVPVFNGTLNSNTSWIQVDMVTTVGTDPIQFIQYTYNAATFLQVSNQSISQYNVLVGVNSISIGSVGPGTAGQIFQSGGNSANPAYSTSTYPTTNAINTLLYASSANIMAALATGNNGVLITSATGVPSWLADGTTGQVLTATTGSPPSWTTIAASSITITGDSGGGLTGNSFTFTGGTTGLTFTGSSSTETLVGTLVVANGGTGAATLTGVLIGNGTSAFTASPITQYDILVGGASNAISSIGPGSAGQILQSGGNAANPAYSTATYPAIATGTGTILRADGTNWSATTSTYPNTNAINTLLYASAANVMSALATGNNGVLITSATGVPSWLADGTTGQVLTATTGSPPSWTTIAASSITITGDSGGGLTGNSFTFTGGITGLTFSGATSTETLGGTLNVGHGGTGATTLTGVLTGNGTSAFTASAITQYDILVGGASNAISSIGPGSAGQILQSGGNAANPAYSTATYPAIATGTGTILRADGTNWSATTSTYPNTNAINTLLYASAANVMSALATGNNGVLITSATGVPSWLADGTTGQVLTATTGSPPSWTTIAASSITITGDSGGGLTGNNFTFTGGTTGLTFTGSSSTETLGGTLVVANGGTGAATLTGVLIGNGTSAFTASPITQYDILVGGASNAISSIGPGSAGQILRSGGNAANPAYSTATYPATAGTSGNVLTSDGTNWNSSAAPGAGLLIASGQLTNSQVKNLHGTPVQAIAAPGAGKVIQVIQSSGTLNYGGNNAFTNVGNSVLGIYYGTTTNINGIVGSAQIVATSSQMELAYQASAIAAAYTTLANTAINLYNPSATEYAGNASNDNTVSYSILYRIITIP